MKQRPMSVSYVMYVIFIALVTILVPPNTPSTIQRLGLATVQYHIAVAFLLLPYALAAGIAFYAFLKLREYAEHLHAAREGAAYRKIAIGIGVLAWGLMVPICLRIIAVAPVTVHWANAGLLPTFAGHIAWFIPLMGFSLIGSGARVLTKVVGTHVSLASTQRFAIFLTTFGALFTYFVINAHSMGQSPYSIPLPLLIATIVIPYFYTWTIGILATYELLEYARAVKGVLYKVVLRELASGIAIVIIGSIAEQVTANVWTGNARSSINVAFILAYGFATLQAIGYGCIALSARKLNKIEVV